MLLQGQYEVRNWVEGDAALSSANRYVKEVNRERPALKGAYVSVLLSIAALPSPEVLLAHPPVVVVKATIRICGCRTVFCGRFFEKLYTFNN